MRRGLWRKLIVSLNWRGHVALSKKWLNLADGIFCNACILTDVKAVDFRKRGFFTNMLILPELEDRTLKGNSLLVDWDKYCLLAVQAYQQSLLEP